VISLPSIDKGGVQGFRNHESMSKCKGAETSNKGIVLRLWKEDTPRLRELFPWCVYYMFVFEARVETFPDTSIGQRMFHNGDLSSVWL